MATHQRSGCAAQAVVLLLALTVLTGLVPSPVLAHRTVHVVLAKDQMRSDWARGAAIFDQHCANCHDYSAHMVADIGPPLYGVVGRRVASVPHFHYSPGLRQGFEHQDIWTAERLDHFFIEPTRLYPGTSMPMAFSAPEDRRAIITFLQSLHDQP